MINVFVPMYLLKIYIIVLIGCLGLLSNLYAHSEKIIFEQYGKLSIALGTGFYEFEINKQMKIAGTLGEVFLSKFCDTIHAPNVMLNFDHSNLRLRSSFTGVGYGKISVRRFHEKDSSFYIDTSQGVIVEIRDNKIDYEKVLKLLEYAIHNEEYIREHQKRVVYDSIQGMIFYTKTISKNIIDKVIESNNHNVDSILKNKMYRDNIPQSQSREIDYYVQNGRYYFYNTNSDAGREFANGKIKGTYGADILVLDNVFEIVGDFNFGHLVFDTDNSFYFIPQMKDTVLGKYTLDSIRSSRCPIRDFKAEWIPEKRIIFSILDNKSRFYKVSLFTDRGLLIQDYKEREYKFITEMLCEIEKEQKEQKWQIVLIVSLVLNSLLILLFAFRRKK